MCCLPDRQPQPIPMFLIVAASPVAPWPCTCAALMNASARAISAPIFAVLHWAWSIRTVTELLPASPSLMTTGAPVTSYTNPLRIAVSR